MQNAAKEIMKDLHNEFTVTYETDDSRARENFRRVRIMVLDAQGQSKFTAITKSGYFIDAPELDDKGKKKKKSK